MTKVKNIWELKTIDESYKVASNNINYYLVIQADLIRLLLGVERLISKENK